MAIQHRVPHRVIAVEAVSEFWSVKFDPVAGVILIIPVKMEFHRPEFGIVCDVILSLLRRLFIREGLAGVQLDYVALLFWHHLSFHSITPIFYPLYCVV